MKKHIVSALNFNILKTNLSKIASKEVKIYVFENYFLKKGVVQQLLLLCAVVIVTLYFKYLAYKFICLMFTTIRMSPITFFWY